MNSTTIQADGIGDMTNQTNMTTTTQASVRSILIPWNNPYNIITKEATDEFLFVIECIVFPILTVFGGAGNIMSLVILLQRKLRNSTGVILIALAVADLCYLITNMIRKSSCIIGRFDEYLEDKISATIFPPMFYLITAFSRVSAWLVVLISIERFIAVAFPMKIKVWISKTRMMVSIVVIYLFVFFLLSPLAAQYTLGTFFNPRTNLTIYRITNSKFYNDNFDLMSVHNEILATLILRHVPVILVILFNLLIIILLQRQRLWRNKKSNSKTKTDDKAQAKITRMLLVISFVCLICTAPGSFILITYRIVDGFELFGKYHNFFLFTSGISTLLTMINSSINFIIYMVFNKQFSSSYKEIFCSCRLLSSIRRRRTMSSDDMSSKKTEMSRTGNDEEQKIENGDNKQDFDECIQTEEVLKQETSNVEGNTFSDERNGTEQRL